MKAKKMMEIFLKREMKKCIFGRNPKASYLMTNTWVVQKKPIPLLFVLRKNGFCIFRQF